ncbi:MAG: S1/P1 nuclease [Bacteroidota bacterium]
MRKILFVLFLSLFQLQAYAWWDAGHLVTAAIAYKNLNPTAKEKVDKLVKFLKRDYPYTNNFLALSTWPDDLKGEGVYAYSTWHYTNIPYNPYGVAIPRQPEVDIIWAIDQAKEILASSKARDVEKARQLAFLIHFVGDLHQPLHSTSYFNNDLPAGNRGGNDFPIASFGKWRNLHACWDDGCGYLSDYTDINPYGEPREPISKKEVVRINELADKIMKAHPKEGIVGLALLDQDFWALESHKLAIEYGYKGVLTIDGDGRKKYIQPNDPVSEYYLEQGQKVVERRLAMGGYRLAMVLNSIFPEE